MFGRSRSRWFGRSRSRWFGSRRQLHIRPDWLGGGVILGTGLMFLMDPRLGRRRRARASQALVHEAHELRDGAGVAARDTMAKTRGLLGRLRLWAASRHVPDEVLIERVRSRLGRASAHPGAIEVECLAGLVELSGPVLRADLERVLAEVRKVPGVTHVDNRLEVHEEPGNVPGLQGHPHAPHQGSLRPIWSPARRLGASLLGLGLTAYGLMRRGPGGLAAGLAGTGLLVRGIVNLPFRRISGIGAHRRAVVVRKIIDVDAPVEEVYAFWSNLESFPRFMDHVKEIRRIGENRWHWAVSGPAGATVGFDVEISKNVPDHLIVWRSLPGSLVRHGGAVRFRRRSGNRTRVDVTLAYNPPAGAIGHAVAALFGADPKHRMNDDLLRFKSLIEYGKATGRAGTVSKQEIGPGAPLPQPQPPERPGVQH